MKNSEQPIYPIVNADGFCTSHHHLNHQQDGAIGLTKREYFAGLAMQGLLHNYVANGMCDGHPSYPLVETEAVRCADALLAELAKNQQP